MKLQAHTVELAGTSYEIGQKLGQIVGAAAPLRAMHIGGMPGFGEEETKQAMELFARWCPGLEEELAGFADALGAAPRQVFYYGMTYLRPRPRCSHLAVLPDLTADGRPLVARNYEFSHEAEDFTLMRTSAQGKYTHMGTSVLLFGRDDGFNQHGLTVTMSSCGFPVGPMEYMRAPQLAGLQFWAVTRALLENCRTVDEALAYLQGMPIAYNLNMMVTDKAGHAALVETLDGRMAAKRVESGYLHATNHPVIDELIPHEPRAMRHSLMRYEWMANWMQGRTGVAVEDLQGMLLSEYPNGPCCHYFTDYFGTTKSMVMDAACGTIDLCWGGEAKNGWQRYSIDQPLADTSRDITLRDEKFDPAMGEYLPLGTAGG